MSLLIRWSLLYPQEPQYKKPNHAVKWVTSKSHFVYGGYLFLFYFSVVSTAFISLLYFPHGLSVKAGKVIILYVWLLMCLGVADSLQDMMSTTVFDHVMTSFVWMVCAPTAEP